MTLGIPSKNEFKINILLFKKKLLGLIKFLKITLFLIPSSIVFCIKLIF